MIVTLIRWAQNTRATHGRLSLNGVTWLTVERSRTDVAHPCIPVGVYALKLDLYHRGGYPAFEIIVPGRSRILIHAANRASELEGCVAVGESLEIFGGEIGITQSRQSLADLMEAADHETTGTLTVSEAWA